MPDEYEVGEKFAAEYFGEPDGNILQQAVAYHTARPPLREAIRTT
jgi:hypothetical protein